MVHLLRSISISRKLQLISLLPLLALLITSVALTTVMYQVSLELRKTSTMQAVDTAYGMLQWAYEKQRSGQWSEQQAQSYAREALKGMRYAGSEYFWVTDMTPTMVMHPTKPQLDGHDVSSIKDPNGVALFVRFVDTVRANGAGFVEYSWPRPGEVTPVPKVSYVKQFAPWGWVLGSGVYIDDLKASFFKRLEGIGLGLLVASFLCLYVAGLVSRIIVRGVAKAVQVASEISTGKILTEVQAKGSDEIASLLRAMSSMSHSLGELIKDVHQTADTLSVASSEIACGNQDLSARTEQAAANLQQTAASMSQLAADVISNADVAQQAIEHVQTTSRIVSAGGEAVSSAVRTMQSINQASARITEIVSVIDAIAFQTNLLALNAAVEAARAGEQGRGFAVVASEVRQLAQRSAASAREVKSLIDTSVATVEQGSLLVGQAGSVMASIQASIDVLQAQMAGIASSSKNQRDGITQVNEAVNDLDRMTQQNAALVEQSAAATASLRDQATSLLFAVGKFKVAG